MLIRPTLKLIVWIVHFSHKQNSLDWHITLLFVSASCNCANYPANKHARDEECVELCEWQALEFRGHRFRACLPEPQFSHILLKKYLLLFMMSKKIPQCVWGPPDACRRCRRDPFPAGFWLRGTTGDCPHPSPFLQLSIPAQRHQFPSVPWIPTHQDTPGRPLSFISK